MNTINPNTQRYTLFMFLFIVHLLSNSNRSNKCFLLFTGQLFIFYAIFYAVLAAMFAICMQGLFRTLSDSEPKWQLDKSLIGTNPGLGYRPQSETETERGSIIQFDSKKNAEKEFWINLLNEFLEGTFF